MQERRERENWWRQHCIDHYFSKVTERKEEFIHSPTWADLTQSHFIVVKRWGYSWTKTYYAITKMFDPLNNPLMETNYNIKNMLTLKEKCIYEKYTKQYCCLNVWKFIFCFKNP